MADDQYAGPINFAVFVFPQGADLTEVAEEVRQLAASHTAEVLDVERIQRGPDGRAVRAELSGSAEILAGAETDLLPADALDVVAEQLGTEEEAFVIIYEDRTLAGLAAVSARTGGRESLVGSIDPVELIELVGSDR